MKNLLKNKKLLLSLLVLFMVVYPFLMGLSNYFMTLFVMICIYSVASMGLNLLVGYGGQLSVGHAAFLTIGAYGAAVFSTKLGFPIIIGLLMAGLVSAAIGLVIGFPAVRLKGHFLAVATLGFGLSIPEIALNWDNVTGGYSGLMVSRPEYLSSNLSMFYVVVFVTVLITWLMYNILKSRFGRAFIAIRESEVAAQAAGVNVSFYKTLMFVVSAFFTGLAGGLYAYWIGFVSPNDFPIMISFLLLAMIVVGGLASIPGAIIGAIIFTVIPHYTDAYVGITNIVIGGAVVVIILFKPNGLITILKGKNKAVASAEEKSTGKINVKKVGEV
ncbi:branched-chain amino acid ABC transporter permease [Sporosarcina sp. CAU 1771]